ncbi:flagellar biosynthesis anti-sigma factor FlgM [Desulfopila sp. IMCC35008]|uniref:flagellar biosynthesis anti-sigma factor FlgM n=1 Tax=Desulfopila sp. IMCC35008 TaxID=2653858 RepID=UPI0013D18B74|nr:flagellar biosynthesis anti-sigma factor FlgM [Desulfopila sp. IMCC35008]
MSVEFFGVGGPNQIGSLKKTQKPSSDQKTETSKADKVEFSSVLQDVHKANAAKQSSDSDRAERVEQIRAQIADGSYKPDLEKVASSLMQFLLEGK